VKTALPLVPVRAWSADGTRYVSTCALLDSGSTTSFCTENLAKSLGIEGKLETLTLSTLEQAGGRVEMPALSMRVTDIKGQKVVHFENIYATRKLPVTAQSGVTAEDVSKWPHLRGIDLVGSSMLNRVDILNGQDMPEALTPLEVRRGGSRAPYAVKTVFGWTVQGPVGRSQQAEAIVNFVKDEALQESLDRFWKLDSTENIAEDTKEMSQEDMSAVSLMERTVKYEDSHYEIAIPFKKQDVNLPDNRQAAEIRLHGLSKRLSHNAALHEKYSMNMQNLFDKG